MAISQADHDAEVTALKDRIKELEGLLGLHQENLGVAFRLSPQLTKLMGLLMAVPNVTNDMIQKHLMISADAKVTVLRLREALAPWQIDVRGKRGLGYWIDAETKQRVRQLMTGRALPDRGQPPVRVTPEMSENALPVLVEDQQLLSEV